MASVCAHVRHTDDTHMRRHAFPQTTLFVVSKSMFIASLARHLLVTEKKCTPPLGPPHLKVPDLQLEVADGFSHWVTDAGCPKHHFCRVTLAARAPHFSGPLGGREASTEKRPRPRGCPRECLQTRLVALKRCDLYKTLAFAI